MAPLFANSGYARFWTAETISMFGSYITTVALPSLAILTLHATDAQAGLLNGARWVPYLLFGLLAGVFADRYRRRPILIGSNLASFVLWGAVAGLALAGLLNMYVLMGFIVVIGMAALLNDAAHQAFLPRLVPAAQLTPANARLQLSGSLAQTTGPFLGGSLVAAIGAPFAILADAVSYLGAALLLMTVKAEEPAPRRENRNLRAELAQGLSFVYRHPLLAPVALTLHARFLFVSVTSTVFTLFVMRGLNPGMSEDAAALGLGLVLALGGVGAVAGNAVSARVTRLGAGRAMVLQRVGEACSWVVIPFAVAGTAGWVVAGAGQFLVWFFLGASGPVEMGWRQAITPDHLQGRVNATIRSLNWGMITIGAPIGGLLAERLGYRPALWAGIAGVVLAAIVAALSPIRRATLPEPAEATTAA
ncbi:MFS transporter [Longispora albida]|uniref:MFS transporter n=1 Tax=Longispora albida TaxID=203523 RepID=UPI000375ADBD|nr:MFS transporter [Longispora albida]